MKKLLPLSLLLIMISSCTNTLTLSVIEPAPVTLSGQIKKVGIINRSLTSENAAKVDKLDQVLSGELGDIDKVGAEETILGVTEELNRNERFEEVRFLQDVSLTSYGSGVFPIALDWGTVDSICAAQNVDALFILELFDTDTKISYSTVPVTVKGPGGIEIPAVEHIASMTTLVTNGWRIYDPINRSIRDEFQITEQLNFQGRGINPVAAAGALLGRKDAVKQVGYKAGVRYAQRILPYRIRVSREYYVKGSSKLKIARRRAQTNNWDGAGELWYEETSNPKAKVAARAYYNMAIINEINGDLDLAIEWAQKAYEDYGDRRALNYLQILQNRKARQLQLQQQLEDQ